MTYYIIMKYSCYKCGKYFNQKGHLETHLNKKKSCQKCNVSFKTNYAYINNEQVHITDYINQYKNIKCKIKCNKGHDLVLVNGSKRRPYFRHKNSSDTGGSPMTNWHINWQSYFPETEVCLSKKEGQIKNRRADILVRNYNTIIEIEHSGKTQEEVICKSNDCKLHGMDIIWVIDGNTDDVILDELSDGSYMVTFLNDWKYKAFAHTYEYILLDINANIFKVPVNNVIGNMIKLKQYVNMDTVVSCLRINPLNIWSLWEDSNSVSACLSLWEKGAGNGKTYSMWESVIVNPDKNLFILLTNTHSEKDVVLAELKDQKDREVEHIKTNIYEQTIEGFPDGHQEQRQYVLTYKNIKSNREVTIIIATMSSFYYNITDMDRYSARPFDSLITNFINEGATKVRNNSFSFAGGIRKLNKYTEIWFDEAEDLDVSHITTISKLMHLYNIDVNCVGNKLQSARFEKNTFTEMDSIDQIPGIDVIKHQPVNINRRIQVRGMAEQINKLVPFAKFGLPEITVYNEQELDEVESPFEIINFDGTIRANDYTNENKYTMNNFCDIIINKFEKEIRKYMYYPEDISIVSSIIASRLELPEIKSRFESLWIKLFNDDSYRSRIPKKHYWYKNNHVTSKKYVEYVQLHKSEEGTAINLKESDYKTRIYSIITSRGDGRKVVLLLNITERCLKLLASHKIGLRYESFFHIALTRAKRKIFFHLQNNHDDIHRRFGNIDNVFVEPDITNRIPPFKRLADYVPDNIIKGLLKDNEMDYDKLSIEQNRNIEKFDYTDHCSRYWIYKILLHFYLNSKYNKTDHCSALYRDIIHNAAVNNTNTSSSFYWKTLNIYSARKMREDTIDYFLINYDNKYYEGFANSIRTIFKSIQEKLEYHDYNDIDSLEFQEKEYICLAYMICIQRYRNKTPITINQLYNIINNISNRDIKTQCFYKSVFDIKKVSSDLMNDIEITYGKLKWNIEHSTYYEGKTETFLLKKPESEIIGHNDKYVVDVMLKTTFSELNYFETMKEILLNRFVLYNPMDKDIPRFFGKKIVTYILILETNQYVKFEFEWDKDNKDINEVVKTAIFEYYSSYNSELFYYCNKVCRNWNISDCFENERKITNPFKYMIKKLESEKKNPNYHICMLEDLNNKWSTHRMFVKDVINNEHLFVENMKKFLYKDIDDFIAENNNSELLYDFD